MIADESGSTEDMMASEAVEEVIAIESVTMDIYPNPSRPSDHITVHITGTHDPVKIKLMDMMGKLYYENTLSTEDFPTGMQITPAEQLLNGIYIMVIHQGNKTLKQKVIVKE
jgi:hypothetical protein